MAMQKILRCGVVLAGIVCGLPAWGQSATLSERFLDNQPQATVRPAPKPQPARRQPRAADVPPATQSAAAPSETPEALEDEALNRKISGICRGC